MPRKKSAPIHATTMQDAVKAPVLRTQAAAAERSIRLTPPDNRAITCVHCESNDDVKALRVPWPGPAAQAAQTTVALCRRCRTTAAIQLLGSALPQARPPVTPTLFALRVKTRIGRQTDNEYMWPIGAWLRWDEAPEDTMGPAFASFGCTKTVGDGILLHASRDMAERQLQAMHDRFPGVICEVVAFGEVG